MIIIPTQVWARFGVKMALLSDCWHDKRFANQMWARSGNYSAVFKMLCRNCPSCDLDYVVLANAWTTSNKPHLGHQRAIIIYCIWAKC